MNHPRQFKLTEQHINLLANMKIDWDDSAAGGPCVNPCSPYGTGFDPGVVLRHAGIPFKVEQVPNPSGHTITRVPAHLQAQARKIHHETATALQIVLSTREMVPGLYRRTDLNGLRWERIGGSRP